MKLIASQVDILLDHTRSFIDRLDFPSWEEYITAATAAIHDVRVASVSTWKFTYISFRPIFILLGILSHYLAILLRIIAKHSIAHGWRAAKEGYFQLRIATIWFVQFQKELPTSAKYVELGVLVAIATLFLLRRHVKKYRYAERINKWYNGKKRLALRKYHRLVERVAKSSSILAAILPHLFYFGLALTIKRVAPSIVTYFATRTYLCSIISFWHPLYLTFSVLGKLAPHLKDYKEEVDANEKSAGKKKGMTPSKLKQRQQKEIEIEELRAEAVDLLKYWVVYAILLAVIRTGKLLPVIGQMLNVTSTDTTTATPSKGFFGRTPKSGLYSKLRLSGKFVEEVTLVFIIWLRLMPASITSDEVKENVTNALSPIRRPITTKGAASFGETKEQPRDVNKHTPVDILYSKLSPIVLSAMSTSAFLTKRALGGDSRHEGSSWLSSIIQKLQLFLDAFVFVRVISKETKEWIIVTMVESSALLPAVTTLLMPSYFTSYGVIYVSLMVPAGYSISSCNEIQRPNQKLDTLMVRIDDASRYLQFWMVHAAITLLIASFAPLMAWIPLSTHVTWLLWAYAQLESSTRKFYGWFESELGKSSIEETAIARSTKRIIAALPSSVESDDKASDDIIPEAEGDKTKVE